MKKWKIFGVVFLVFNLFIGYRFYTKTYNPVVIDPNGKYLYIATGSSFQDVVSGLKESNFITDDTSFEKLAGIKKYKNNVKPGRYRIDKGMSNNDLVNLLRSGVQEEVNITFNNSRTKEKAAGLICRNLEADSAIF